MYVLPKGTQETGLRTNIELDDDLIAEAMAATGLPTKKATVEEGLRLLVRRDRQLKALAETKGIGWEGDLDAMREGRVFDPQK
jgi:Arc/MetJ family transcription regulator